MLKKLLKYEFKRTGKLTLLLTLGAALIGGLSILLIQISKGSELAFTLTLMLSVLLIMIVMYVPVACAVIFVVTSYQNLYSDAGYLTFTLPVSVEKLLLSKAICGAVTIGVSSFVSYGAYFTFYAFLMSALTSQPGFGMSSSEFPISELLGIFTPLNIVLIVFMLLLLAVFSSVTILVSLSVGQLVGKVRILLAFGVMSGINAIASIPAMFIVYGVLIGYLTTELPAVNMLAVILALLIIYYSALTVGGWFIAVRINKRKLNLV